MRRHRGGLGRDIRGLSVGSWWPAGRCVRPAADPVSLQSAVGFSALGSEHAAIAGEGVEELGRSGVAVGESGIGYAAGDAVAAATYLVSGGSL